MSKAQKRAKAGLTCKHPPSSRSTHANGRVVCRDCDRARKHAARRRDPAHERTVAAEYREENRERVRAYDAQYRADPENHERIKAQKRDSARRRRKRNRR